MIIGFIGQGWIGKNYADDFEKRGFDVVRYSKEKKYIKEEILTHLLAHPLAHYLLNLILIYLLLEVREKALVIMRLLKEEENKQEKEVE